MNYKVRFVCLFRTFSSKLFIICLSRPRASPCSPFAQNTWASSSCHDDTGDAAQDPLPPCCFIWKTARSASWTGITTVWVLWAVLAIFTRKIKGNIAHALRGYLCISSPASQPAELHEVVSEHGAEELGAVGVSHPGYEGVLGHGADGKDGLHQSKVTVGEQPRVLPPLTANLPQSHV